MMKSNSTKVLVLTSLCCFLFSCKMLERTGLESVKEITHKIDSLAQNQAISDFTKNAVEGAISGTTTEASAEQIEKLGELLAKELDKAIKNIDTKSPGSNFAKGVTEKLLSKEIEEDLKTLVSNAVGAANGDVSAAIKNIESDLNKSLNKVFANLNSNVRVLETTLINSLSDKLQDSLSTFLTNAIADIEFKALSSRISTELLSSELRDTLSRIVIDIKKEIGKDDGTFSSIKNYIASGIVLIFILSMLWIRYFFYKKKKSEELFENDMSDTLENVLAENQELKDRLFSALDKKESLRSFRQNMEKRNPTKYSKN